MPAPESGNSEKPVIASDLRDFYAEKAFWCQPWTIILTGVLAISSSWLVLHRFWVTIPVALAVLAWWMLFLVIAPAAYRNQLR